MDDVVRTPDKCFVELPGFDFEPHYATVRAEGTPPVRMHYVDAGPADGEVVLLLHGQPTWSYLYRKVIPVLAAAGLRAIAPDHIGFGRSDKLTERTDYTFSRHIEWMGSFLTALDLTGITLLAQDWGGPIGLGALAADPDRFSRVVASNTILHTADPSLADRLVWANYGLGDSRVVLEEALVDYLLYYYRAPDIVPSFFLEAGAGPLPPEVLAAYDAPFPDPLYKAGLRQLTGLLPLTRNDPGAIIDQATMAALGRFERPFLTAYSDGDPPTSGWDTVFQEWVPGAVRQPHTRIAGAGHFLQEQRGEELGRIVVDFIAANPAA
jgi:haloalkane dehalogenase